MNRIKTALYKIFNAYEIKSLFIMLYLFITPVILFALFLTAVGVQNELLLYLSLFAYCILFELTRRAISSKLMKLESADELQNEVDRLNKLLSRKKRMSKESKSRR